MHRVFLYRSPDMGSNSRIRAAGAERMGGKKGAAQRKGMKPPNVGVAKRVAAHVRQLNDLGKGSERKSPYGGMSKKNRAKAEAWARKKEQKLAAAAAAAEEAEAEAEDAGSEEDAVATEEAAEAAAEEAAQ